MPVEGGIKSYPSPCLALPGSLLSFPPSPAAFPLPKWGKAQLFREQCLSMDVGNYLTGIFVPSFGGRREEVAVGALTFLVVV